MTKKEMETRINKAIEVAFHNATYDGGHHKMWVINEMLRKLLGKDGFQNFVDAYELEDGERQYTWPKGIAP